jgi:hypothetical protein
MDYQLSRGPAISEADALAEAEALGLNGYAFDLRTDVDEPLHWHEFSAVTWVIEGSGSFRDQHGDVIEVGPGCRVEAPAGFLHQGLAGNPQRVVLGTDLPYEQWTQPIDKDPADRPEHLRV